MDAKRNKWSRFHVKCDQKAAERGKRSRFFVTCDQKGSEKRQFDMLCGYEHDKNGDAGESSLE